jgi:hypothetical protein
VTREACDLLTQLLEKHSLKQLSLTDALKSLYKAPIVLAPPVMRRFLILHVNTGDRARTSHL